MYINPFSGLKTYERKGLSGMTLTKLIKVLIQIISGLVLWSYTKVQLKIFDVTHIRCLSSFIFIKNPTSGLICIFVSVKYHEKDGKNIANS